MDTPRIAVARPSFADDVAGPQSGRPRRAIALLGAAKRLAARLLRPLQANAHLSDFGAHRLRDIGIAPDQLDLVKQGRWPPPGENP